jgi:hypothetical protein
VGREGRYQCGAGLPIGWWPQLKNGDCNQDRSREQCAGEGVYNVRQYGITLKSQNLSSQTCQRQVLNLYNGQTATSVLAPGQVFQQVFLLKASFGWYDLVISVESDPTFRQQLAGHLETGEASRTDPGAGSSANR